MSSSEISKLLIKLVNEVEELKGIVLDLKKRFDEIERIVKKVSTENDFMKELNELEEIINEIQKSRK